MNIKHILSISLVSLLAACGGGGDGDSSTGAAATDAPTVGIAGDNRPDAKTLSYTNPTGNGWRLVKDASSSATRIVLNLVGPAGTTSRGVGFNLRKGSGVAFGTFPNGAYALNTGVFELKGTNANFEPYAGTAADPVLFVSAPLKSGDVLSTGIFQKDRTNSPKDLTKPLVQVAVELPVGEKKAGANSAATPNRSGDVIALGVVKARMIPADIGGFPDFMLTPEVIAKARMVDITVDVGRLVAN